MVAVPSFAEGDLVRAASARASGRQSWLENVFSHSASLRNEIDEEEALKWADDRLRTSILQSYDPQTGNVDRKQVDVRHLGLIERQALMDKLITMTEEDNEMFLKKLRRRIDCVGVELPTVEVRYESLKIDAKCFVGGRALPTVTNSIRNLFETILDIVGIPAAKSVKLTILSDVSGIIKPGRMTLLLGPPSSGKTTLLLALAGKLDPALKSEGTVTYNGHQLHEFVPQKTSAYISQHDLHIGELTVRETLEFSARFQGIGTRYEMTTELARREKQQGIIPEADIDLYMKATASKEVQSRVVTDYVLKILGLDVCADTMFGDDMRRGISGGQKKRVTTGEMIVGPTKTLFMDEISTGLDSSTTFQIIKCLQQFAHVLEGTILMSLLQPAPETYDLFDDILLISEGQVVYHGPREKILEFFEGCGFKCPERKGAADFLQEVTSRKDQEQYWADRRMPYRYITVKEFSEAFKQFGLGRELAFELSTPYDRTKSHPAALVNSNYSISKWDMFKASFEREWLLMKRNSFIYVFKTTQIIIVAFITMTVFLRTTLDQGSVDQGTLYLGALFFGLTAIMFNGFAELSMTIFRLPVFFKQRDLKFYPAWAFSLPTFVLSLPMSLVEVAVWTGMTYYVIGYSPDAVRFFRQFFVLFLVHQMSSSLFRFIAALCQTMVIANTGGSLSLLIFFILGGFIIPRTEIPKWWIWGYWISPLAYGENAISVNEFLAPRWKTPFQSSTIGAETLRSRAIFTTANWYWIGIGALIGFTVLFNLGFTWALTYLKPLGNRKGVISEETLAEIEASQQGKSYERSSRSRRKSISKRTGLYESEMHSISEASSIDLEAASGVAPKRGMSLPYEPLAISFNDVSYYVDMPVEMKEQGVNETRRQLLRSITGAFRPGVLTSLMGVSGAGKTTLMDVLAGRKTGGYIEGDIRISGFPKQQETFARVAGYCEQTDIHSPQVTVYESLVFSAWLRLPQSINADEKMKFVEDVMNLVELDNLRDALVGIRGATGLSTEQRKRLTIAVELVANPSIIFMDEPTSGLDARAAAIVMRTVRNTVDTGRTVVCTIHQPSIDIFEAFDELLLLKRGGQVIYAGPLGRRSQSLVDYFEAIPGVAKITDGYNPATWMLEVTSVSAGQRLNVDFAEVYKNSQLYQRNKTLVQQLSKPASGAKDLHFPSQYSQTWFAQMTSCLWKQHLTYWRSPDYNGVRLAFTVVAALLFGSIFWDRGTKRKTQADLFAVMGAMYGATIFLGIQNCSTVQPVVAMERTVFYRERAAGMYAAIPYALSQVLIEIPYILVQAILYGTVTYAMIGFEWTVVKFFWYIFMLFFTFMYFTYYGMMAVAITPNHQVAAIMASAFYALFNLFSGFIIPQPKIPKWWVWYYWICPVAWTVNGLISSQYGDVKTPMSLAGGGTKNLDTFLDDYFGFQHDFLGVVAAVLVGFSVFFAFMFAFCIKILNFQQR